MNLNKVMLIGRIGKDPEINYIKEDIPVARFSLATNESYKTKEGEWRDITEWHNITAWRYTAKYCENNLKKGMLVFVEGKLQTRQWENQEGIKRYTTEIVAEQIRLLEKKSDDNTPPLPEQEPPVLNTSNQTDSHNNIDGEEKFSNSDEIDTDDNKNDDLPF